MVGSQARDSGARLGMLMPASNDAKKDREIFLKVLTMDD
jgi:putative DNA methylase